MSFFRTTRLRSRKQKTQLESEEPEELLSERVAGKEGKGHIEKPYQQILLESFARRSRGNVSRPLLASAELVPISFETFCQSTLDNQTRKTYINSSEQTRDTSSVAQEPTSTSLSCVRTSLHM